MSDSDEECDPDDADVAAAQGPLANPRATMKYWGLMEIALHRRETESSPAATKVCDSRVRNAYP
jgi:hypothetical protein